MSPETAGAKITLAHFIVIPSSAAKVGLKEGNKICSKNSTNQKGQKLYM